MNKLFAIEMLASFKYRFSCDLATSRCPQIFVKQNLSNKYKKKPLRAPSMCWAKEVYLPANIK
jgi:hypothetical protein